MAEDYIYPVGSDTDELTLYRIDEGDTIQKMVEKINLSFQSIAKHGGGPAGIDGINGLDGIDGVDGGSAEYIYSLSDYMELDVNYPLSEDEKRNLFDTITSQGEGKYNNTKWTDHPQGVSSEHKTEYMMMRFRRTDSDGNVSSWYYTSPVIWSHWGETGTDGDGVEYIFNTNPNKLELPKKEKLTKTQKIIYNIDDFYPAKSWFEVSANKATAKKVIINSGYLSDSEFEKQWNSYFGFGELNSFEYWTDNPKGTSSTIQEEYVSIRKSTSDNENGKVWGDFSEPTLWSHWGVDGMDGNGIEYIFRLVDKYPITLTESEWNNWQKKVETSDVIKLIIETDDFYPGLSWFMSSESEINKDNYSKVKSKADSAGIPLDTNLWKTGYGILDNNYIKDWMDNPCDVSKEQPFELVSIRKFTDGVWGTFSFPKLWAKYSINSFVSFAFTATNTDISNVTPTGGTWVNPLPNKDSVNNLIWTDNPQTNDPNCQVWMTKATFVENATSSPTWTKPQKMKDTSSFNVEWSNNDITLSQVGLINTSLKNSKYNFGTLLKANGNDEDAAETAWRNLMLTDFNLTFSDNAASSVLMATCNMSNDTWSDWEIVRVKGEKGDQGTSLEIQSGIMYECFYEDDSAYKSKTYNWTNSKAVLNNYVASLSKTPGAGEYGVVYDVKKRIDDSSIYDKEPEGIHVFIYKSNKWVEAKNTSAIPDLVSGYTLLSPNGHMIIWDGDSWIDAGKIKGENGQSMYIKYAFEANSTDPLAVYVSVNGKNLYIKETDDAGYAEYIGMCVSLLPPETLEGYSWNKFKGDDGFGYEYIYTSTTTEDAPDVPSRDKCSTSERAYWDDNVGSVDFCPTVNGVKWYDDPMSVSPENRYIWMVWRRYDKTGWTGFYGDVKNTTKAKLWAFYSNSIDETNEYYLASNNKVANSSTMDFNASTYKPGSSWVSYLNAKNDWGKDKIYLWNIEEIKYNDGHSTYTEPQIIAMYSDGIKDIKEYYCLGKTADSAPCWDTATDKPILSKTGGTAAKDYWTTQSVKAISLEYSYLWNIEEIIYNEKPSEFTSPVVIGVFNEAKDGMTVDLSNEMETVNVIDGKATTKQDISTTISLWYGNVQKELNVSDISISGDEKEVIGVDITSSNISNYVSKNSDGKSLDFKFSISAGKALPEFANIVLNIKYGDYNKLMTLKIVAIDGDHRYALNVSDGSIKVAADGEFQTTKLTVSIVEYKNGSVSGTVNIPKNTTEEASLGYKLTYSLDGGGENTLNSSTINVPTTLLKNVKVNLYWKSVLIDTETIPVVKDGSDSLNTFKYDLSNDTFTIGVGSDKILSVSSSTTTQLSAWYGTNNATISEIKCNVIDNDNDKKITTSISGNTITVNIAANTIFNNPKQVDITFNLKYAESGKTTLTGSGKITFNVVGIPSGQDGVMYGLLPSTYSIKKNVSGNYIPSTVLCGKSCDDNDYVIKYSVGNGSDVLSNIKIDGKIAYSTSVTVNSDDGITFYLFDGDGNCVDVEYIPVVIDGTNGKTYQRKYARFIDTWGTYNSVSISNVTLDTPTITFSTSKGNKTATLTNSSSGADKDHCIEVMTERYGYAGSWGNWSSPVIIARQFSDDEIQSKINAQLTDTNATLTKFITDHADEQVESAMGGYATIDYVDQNLDDYAKTSDIPTDYVNSSALSNYVASQNFAKQEHLTANSTFETDSNGYLILNNGTSYGHDLTYYLNNAGGTLAAAKTKFKTIYKQLASISETVNADHATVSVIASYKTGTTVTSKDIAAGIFAEANADGSTIKLGADHITLTGNVVIKAINGNNNGTTIDGSNITTGSITATQINADNLHVKAANIDGTLTADKISSDVIVSSINGASTTINGNRITTGSITADKIDTDNLVCKQLNVVNNTNKTEVCVPQNGGYIEIKNNGNVSNVFSGEKYTSISSMFGSSGTLSYNTIGEKSISNTATLEVVGSVKYKYYKISSGTVTGPTTVSISGNFSSSSKFTKLYDQSAYGGSSSYLIPGEISTQLNIIASPNANLEDYEYTESQASTSTMYVCTSVRYDENINTWDTSSRTLSGNQFNISVSGTYYLYVELKSFIGQAEGVSKISASITSLSYASTTYVSRYFANGFCLGTSANNYIAAYNSGNYMYFECCTGGKKLYTDYNGLHISNDLFTTNVGGVVGYGIYTYAGSSTKYISSSCKTGSAIYNVEYVTSYDGCMKVTLKTGYQIGTNCIVNATGYGRTSNSPMKATLIGISSTSTTFYVIVSDDTSANNEAGIGAVITVIAI